MVVYPTKNPSQPIQYTQLYDLYFCQKKFLEELKGRIMVILNKREEISKELGFPKISKNHIRLWRITSTQVSTLKKQINEYVRT